MNLEIPEPLGFYATEKRRYKVSYGGRGAGKSWAVADCLLAEAIKKTCRILCTRELQNTIKDSVHRLLCDRIIHHKLEKTFDITESEIRCKNGSLFIFKGLRTNTTEIKSLEGIDFCWVEEAQKVSDESWSILLPTIRNPESEIWITFNTGLETDPVYQRWVKAQRPDSIVRKVNYMDNPWFPDVLRKEMEFDRENAPLRYRNVWLGEPGGEGLFFQEFGIHLREQPFQLQPSQAEGRLIGSLDSGTTHNTSFGLWYLDPLLTIHRLFTYCNAGGTIQTHAQMIFDRIESNSLSCGYFPDQVYADPSMWTKVKLNENMVRAPIDEYVDLFRAKHQKTVFLRANNDRENGCQIMRMLFRKDDNGQRFMYWDHFNRSFEEGIGAAITDPNHLETYLKQDGDDVVDDARYGLVAANSLMALINKQREYAKPKTHLERVLAGEFATVKESGDWYNQ